MTIEPEEYKIYAALIDATHVHTNANVRLIVLLNHTDMAPTYDGRSTLNLVKKRAPALLPGTLDDFESKNATPCALDYTFDLTVEYLLIGDEVKSMAFASKVGWADQNPLTHSGPRRETRSAGLGPRRISRRY